jgi:hypothetical protein
MARLPEFSGLILSINRTYPEAEGDMVSEVLCPERAEKYVDPRLPDAVVVQGGKQHRVSVVVSRMKPWTRV